MNLSLLFPQEYSVSTPIFFIRIKFYVMNKPAYLICLEQSIFISPFNLIIYIYQNKID